MLAHLLMIGLERLVAFSFGMSRNKATDGRTWRLRAWRQRQVGNRITWGLSFAEAKTQNPDQVCGECYVSPAFFRGTEGKEGFYQ
uniref:Uncharacterized protein n=1 Tax=Setaria italica TaxID=4555 RepID=K4AHC8_SETIT